MQSSKKNQQQCTLANSITLEGIGVHSGQAVRIKLQPAPLETGIVFRRTVGAEAYAIQASFSNLASCSFSTNLVKDNIKVATIEHLLAACAGCGIDNLYVDLSAEEVPIMDGSASDFVFAIHAAGIKTQDAQRKYYKVIEPLEVVAQNGARISVAPYAGFKVNFKIDYQHSAIPQEVQNLSIDFNQTNFIYELSRARTYGFFKDYAELKKHNLAQGASLENTLVFSEHDVMNEDGLRCFDECVRHKMLDLIGDFYLLGKPLLCEVTAYKSGHALNHQLLQALLQQQKIVELTFDAAIISAV